MYMKNPSPYSMKQVLRSFLRMFPVYFVIIIAVTNGLFRAYFEQDEWAGFSTIINFMTLPWWHIFIPFEMHFSPIPSLIWSAMYQTFALHAQYYYLVEFIIHASVSALVFIFTERITKNKYIGGMTGLFFLLNSRAHQAFTHLAIFNSTDTCMFFIMLFFVYLSTIRGKLLSLRQAGILFLIFLAAICTREEGFIIIPAFIAYIVCFDKEKIHRQNVKSAGLMILGLGIFFIGRYYAQTLRTISVPSQYQINANRAFYNLLTIPIKLVIQNLLYYAHIANFFLARYEKFYPGMIKNFFTDNAPLMDIGFFYLFGISASVTAVWSLLVRPVKMGPLIIFFSVWIFSHAFMLSFVGYPIFVLEPRYLYFSAFPVFAFLSVMIYSAITSRVLHSVTGLITKSAAVILAMAILITSYREIRNVVKGEILRGQAKTSVLSSLHRIHPNLAKNTIFFVQCKTKCHRNGDLGIPNENVLPFSSGPGMIFLITYAVGQEDAWGPFFTNSFLFDIYAEGYKKINNRSFGYFVTKSKLKDALIKNNLSNDVVVALEYDEETYTLRDISEDFKKTIGDISAL